MFPTQETPGKVEEINTTEDLVHTQNPVNQHIAGQAKSFCELIDCPYIRLARRLEASPKMRLDKIGEEYYCTDIEKSGRSVRTTCPYINQSGEINSSCQFCSEPWRRSEITILAALIKSNSISIKRDFKSDKIISDFNH